MKKTINTRLLAGTILATLLVSLPASATSPLVPEASTAMVQPLIGTETGKANAQTTPAPDTVDLAALYYYDLMSGTTGALGKLPYLLRDYGKALSSIPGTRGFHSGIKGQKVSLKGNIFNNVDDLLDLLGSLLNAAHRCNSIGHHF